MRDGYARPSELEANAPAGGERRSARAARRDVRFSALAAMAAQVPGGTSIDNWPPEGKLAAAVLVMMAVGGLLSKLVDYVVTRD